jgi:hypothetical protein
MSGTTAPGTPARRGGPAAASTAAAGARVPGAMPGAGAFEEAEGTRHLLGRRADIVQRNPG